MKTFKILITVVVLATAFNFQSCSSDDGDASGTNTGTYIRFTVNGTDYDFSDIITAESTVITFNGNNGASITDPGDTQMGLWLPLTITNGAFDVSNAFGADYQISFTSNDLNFDFDFASSGTITVTQSTSDFVEGTFTATVTNDDGDTINITSGTFRANNI